MTTTNTTKDDEEKPSGILKSAVGLVKSVATAMGLAGQSKDDGITDMDVDSMGPVNDEGEEMSEVLFQSLLDSCTEDEVVVRSVRNGLIFRSSFNFDILGFTS